MLGHISNGCSGQAQHCPISRAMSKSRDIASQARSSIAREGSSISLVCCLPRCRIVMANLAEGAARAAGCDTSFCCRRCVMPSKPGVGTVLLLTSAVCREPLDKLIRRKLMPSLEHVTWRGGAGPFPPACPRATPIATVTRCDEEPRRAIVRSFSPAGVTERM